MKVKAVELVREIPAGWSKPLLFRCDDGNDYVVKLMSNPQGLKVLPNELFAYKLGRLLKLPVGKYKVVHISKKLIKSCPMLHNKYTQAGPHVGSLFYKEAQPLKTEQDLKGCKNLKQAADMIAFDHWIQNWDRADNSPNILVVAEGGNKRFILIDHANAFTGHWTFESLRINRTELSAYWGSAYELFLPYIDNENPFGDILQRIYALNKDDLWAAMSNVPKEWLPSAYERYKLIKYLDYRKAVLEMSLMQLKSYFNRWK